MHPLPPQLLQSLQGLPGFDEQSFVEVHSGNSKITSVRINTARELAADHFPEATPVPWCEYGRYLPERPSFTLDPVFHGGGYYVQEASSMFLHHVIKQIFQKEEQPAAVLDLCGAPGGKSTLIASALPNSFIVANEVIKSRVGILAENVSKWGSSNVLVTNNDPADFSGLPAFFNLMVVDAPCSGSGLFRKDNKAIEEWSEANVQLCSLRQQRILADAIPALAHNGFLVYSTCSYSRQENEDICDWIVEQFQLTPVAIPFDPLWGIVETISEKHKAAGYRFYPGKVQGEGFFIACFKQTHGGEAPFFKTHKLPAISKKEKDIIDPWLHQPEELVLFSQKENVMAFPAKWANKLSIIQQQVSLRKSGVAVGSIKGKDLVPHHELALSALIAENLPVTDLTKEDALKYLKRQNLANTTGQTGWTIMRHQGVNLGWAKLLPTRVNNYYPTNWRILIP